MGSDVRVPLSVKSSSWAAVVNIWVVNLHFISRWGCEDSWPGAVMSEKGALGGARCCCPRRCRNLPETRFPWSLNNTLGHSRANSRLLVLMTVSSLFYWKRMSLVDCCTIPSIGEFDCSLPSRWPARDVDYYRTEVVSIRLVLFYFRIFFLFEINDAKPLLNILTRTYDTCFCPSSTNKGESDKPFHEKFQGRAGWEW